MVLHRSSRAEHGGAARGWIDETRGEATELCDERWREEKGDADSEHPTILPHLKWSLWVHGMAFVLVNVMCVCVFFIFDFSFFLFHPFGFTLGVR